MSLILSLGTIVDTNAGKAIQAFQLLADELQLGIQVRSLMPRLLPFFKDFNLGNIGTEDFKQALMSIFFEAAQQDDVSKQKIFLERFEGCWNAMCVVDDQAKEVFQYIAEQLEADPDSIIICSDTNPAHRAHIESEVGDVFNRCIIRTTFEARCPKQDLLQTIVADNARAKRDTETITLLIGSNDKITDPVLLAMTQERDAGISQAASSAGLKIEQLQGPRVSIEDLERLMPRASVPEPKSLTPAFDTARSPQSSPRAGAQSPATEEQPPVLERRLSPTP